MSCCWELGPNTIHCKDSDNIWDNIWSQSCIFENRSKIKIEDSSYWDNNWTNVLCFTQCETETWPKLCRWDNIEIGFAKTTQYMIEEYSMKRAQSGHPGKILQKVGWKTSRISTFASRGWNLYQMSKHHTNGSILYSYWMQNFTCILHFWHLPWHKHLANIR